MSKKLSSTPTWDRPRVSCQICVRRSSRSLTGGATFAEPRACASGSGSRSEEHTSELQSQSNLVCRLLLEKKKNNTAVRIDRPTQRHELVLSTAHQRGAVPGPQGLPAKLPYFITQARPALLAPQSQSNASP